MKKLGIFVMSLAMAAFTFTSCNKEKGNNPLDDIVENGFYVLGEATGVADLNATGAAKLQMANGKNETEKAEREGMYEKYVILEAGKDFSFIKKEGGLNVHYTANLEEKEIATDGVAIQGGYFGLIRQAEGAMQVKASGLYHIIIDLNLDGKLDGVEGAQVILAPVEFGVRGAMNGWSYTAGVAKEENGMITWSWENQEMAADNAEFKFAHGQCWKINLDDAEQVKAENSLGADMVAGGDNITVGERGLYSISLTFKTEAGAIANSFSYKAERTGDIGIKDYSAVELELVGAAVAEQEGAVADPSSWGWGNVLSLGLPVKNGNIYTWQKTGVKLVVGEYKVRTKNYEAQGDIAAFDNGANIAVAEDVTVDITVTVDAETGKITVDDGTVPEPVEYIEDYFYLLNEGTLTDINVYGWAPNKGDNNEIFGGWPGTRVNGDATSLTRVFFEKAIKGGEYKFIINGTGGQTADPEWVVSFDDPNVHHTLKVTADNELIVVE